MYRIFTLARDSLFIALAFLVTVRIGFADDITTKSDDGLHVVSGAVKYENEERLILETSDGAWSRFSKSEIIKRETKPAPSFRPPEELAKELQADPKLKSRVRVKVTPEVVVILVLAYELAQEHDGRAEKVLEQMVASYTRVADGVRQFAKKFKLTQKKPELLPVILIYESQAAADARKELPANSVDGVCVLEDCGWYSPVTNWATFSLPEVVAWQGSATNVLIWQQLCHTGILKRHSPVPLWFVLGVSAGFDSEGEKVVPNHLKLSSVTFPGLQKAQPVNWDKMASEYDFYINTKDFFFSSFRDQAWGLHWFLINKNKAGYTRYWKMMSELSPLDDYSTEKCLADFKKAFGKNPEAFKPLFTKAFQTAAAVPPAVPPDDGLVYCSHNWGFAKLAWRLDPLATNEVRMDGRLTNVSPLRTRSYCVGYTTNWGRSATWFVDELDPLKTAQLKLKLATEPAVKKAAPNANPQGEHVVEDVWVKSALSNSPEAAKWRKGELPPPPEVEAKAAE